MITEKLLGIILNEKINACWARDDKKNIQFSLIEILPMEPLSYISIYELSMMCKKWIVDQGYQFRIIQTSDKFFIEFGRNGNGFPITISHEGMEEPKYIFDMCEHILGLN